MFKKYILYKNFKFTIISTWITLSIISLLLSIFCEDYKFLIVFVLLFLFITKIQKIIESSSDEGKRFLYTRAGYIFLGISIALIIISTIFNLFYSDHSWLDFRDIGFLFFSFPLMSFLKFELDHGQIISRLTLYLITFLNLGLLIFIIDTIGLLINKIVSIFLKKEL